MLSEEKKILLLLHLIIFNYHGLDEGERELLSGLATKFEAEEELKWAYSMLGNDYYSSHEKIHQWFEKEISGVDSAKRLSYLTTVWEASVKKGFISEMEATAMLKIAHNWGIQKDLLNLIRKK
ncbi:MAG: hypothetical protein ACTHJT_11415 [Cytophaga sp.]|uniref:hypothetical protein n=1 Tax=Cytophaga sp. TaxID=29535 RepID=UPI003F7E6E50